MNPPHSFGHDNNGFERRSNSGPNSVILVGTRDTITSFLPNPSLSSAEVELLIDSLPGLIHARVVMILGPKNLEFAVADHNLALTR